MRKLISIIIATYNAGSTLESCLKSIIAQKNDLIELLIIDGKSSDNTLKIVNAYRNQIDIFISEKDKGIYDAWNKGIVLANGQWIMFIGADDILYSDVLEGYIDFIRLNGDRVNRMDLITAKSEYVDLIIELIKIIGEPYVWNRYRRNMMIAHGTTLHNRALFDEIGLYDINYKICADYELLMRKGEGIQGLFLDKIIMKFKIGGASFSYNCLLETYKIRDKYKTVSPFLNCMLFLRRLLSLWVKKIMFTTKEI